MDARAQARDYEGQPHRNLRCNRIGPHVFVALGALGRFARVGAPYPCGGSRTIACHPARADDRPTPCARHRFIAYNRPADAAPCCHSSHDCSIHRFGVRRTSRHIDRGGCGFTFCYRGRLDRKSQDRWANRRRPRRDTSGRRASLSNGVRCNPSQIEKGAQKDAFHHYSIDV